MYESEHTRFMRRYLEDHPEEIESQKKGRAVWWDKTPRTRSLHPSMRHAPRAAGNEHAAAGGAEHMFGTDDDTSESRD